MKRCFWAGVPYTRIVGAMRPSVTLKVSWLGGVSKAACSRRNACSYSGPSPAPPNSAGQEMAP